MPDEKKKQEEEIQEEEGKDLCPKCGNLMIEESGKKVCSSCSDDIDFLGEDEEQTKDNQFRIRTDF